MPQLQNHEAKSTPISQTDTQPDISVDYLMYDQIVGEVRINFAPKTKGGVDVVGR
jgi:hypothetical protein